GRQFLTGLDDMASSLPHPDGRTLRVTVEVVASGERLGSVEVDTTNAADLGFLASRRHATVHPTNAPVSSGRPNLRLVGGAA
ncbi:hypothetical protein, partial [Streptomyces scabiei]